MNKLVVEAFGTAVLVLVGCGAVTIGGFGADMPLGIVPIALAFGLAVTAMIYAIGGVSGCHINPAVTVAMVVAGRMSLAEGAGYVVAQIVGGIIGAGILLLILQGSISGYDLAGGGLGHNGWGRNYLGGYGTTAAFAAEVIATLIFVLVILVVTRGAETGAVAGLVIGLTLFALHLPFINVTGLSVNPARSIGPAVFVGGQALAQLWLFIVAPVIGGVIAGLLEKTCARR